MAAKIQKSSNLGEIWFWFPSRFWCWELISMVWEPYYDPLCRNIHRGMWQLLGVDTKSEKIWLFFTFVLNWVFLRFPWQRQAFWNFQVSKPFIHMPYNISIKFHPIPSTLNLSRFLWQRNNNHIFLDLVCK
jgi:hypothetical protein